MKGFLNFQWWILPLLLLLAWPAFARTQTILIVKSSDNRFFNRSIETLTNDARAQLDYRSSTLKQLKKQPALLKDIDAMITLGMPAARFANEAMAHTPVIYSYITAQQFNILKHQKQHHAILLNQPFSRYLRFIKLLLNAQSVGILHSRSQAIERPILQRMEQAFAIRIQQKLLSEDDNPISAARDLLQTSDVLLALPDPAIYNRRSLKGILLTSYRQQKPLVSYSPAQVKSGALAAVYSTPQNIGRQIAERLRSLLSTPSQPTAPFQYAKYFDIKINRRIAESLELNIASKESLLNQLQSQQD